jgi:hypothetical protein
MEHLRGHAGIRVRSTCPSGRDIHSADDSNHHEAVLRCSRRQDLPMLSAGSQGPIRSKQVAARSNPAENVTSKRKRGAESTEVWKRLFGNHVSGGNILGQLSLKPKLVCTNLAKEG